MFEIDFQHKSALALPPTFDLQTGIAILHDFGTVVRLSPDCRGCKPIPPPKNAKAVKTNATAMDPVGTTPATIQYFEVEDDLPFMPKKLWSGGVRYQADFLPTEDGCDITVHAPGGFTSTNHWRLLREVSTIPENAALDLDRVVSKDLLHADTGGMGWYVQIVSDARCNRTFAGIIKGFLKNSHEQLELAFVQKMTDMSRMSLQQTRSRRPTLGRRRSSVF